jgi:hypothetical protein
LVAIADRDVPIRLAEVALAGYPEAQKRVALTTLGAGLYRAGRLDEAIRRLDESIKSGGGAGSPKDWAFLAMAHHRRAEFAEARRWLEKLRSSKPISTTGLSWEGLEIGILRREAEDLILGSSPASP